MQPLVQLKKLLLFLLCLSTVLLLQQQLVYPMPNNITEGLVYTGTDVVIVPVVARDALVANVAVARQSFPCLCEGMEQLLTFTHSREAASASVVPVAHVVAKDATGTETPSLIQYKKNPSVQEDKELTGSPHHSTLFLIHLPSPI